MTTYEIKNNNRFGSKEIYFSGKPSEEVRAALKALKCRWHGVKKCWYGFADESTLIAAIQTAEPATVITDGYLGGGAVYGSKCRSGLYGADLAAAIRADIKAAGIKGVTISTRHGNITAKITIERGDLVEDYKLDEWKYIQMLDRYGVDTGRETIRYSDVHDQTTGERNARFAEVYEIVNRRIIEQYAKPHGLNTYYLDDLDELNAAFAAKVKRVNDIIAAYNFDESNSMVDYFHTNFYFDLYTVPGRSWTAAA